MGYNTSAIIMNDALSSIREDKDLGKKIHDGVIALSGVSRGTIIDVSAGGYVNAIGLIEDHHADHMQPLLIGGNTAHVIQGTWVSWDSTGMEQRLLEELAKKLGYTLRKKTGGGHESGSTAAARRPRRKR